MKRCRAYRFGGTAALTAILFLAVTVNVHSQEDPISSYLNGGRDSAVAERYAQWAKDAMDAGRWGEALAALERASDFADVSSDITYLLALARSRANQPRGFVLAPLEKALSLNIWNLCDREDARFLKIETLIAIRAYPAALAELSMVRKGPKEAELTLMALVSFMIPEFRLYMAETLDRYPRETGPVRVFFRYLKAEAAGDRNPEPEDLQLLELILKRLPVLVLKDPELAWMAAPYMRDTAEARRLVMAYRAVNDPVPASLPAALRLGVIDDEDALEELFREELFPAPGKNPVLDIALLAEIWGLLRRQETKALFGRNLSVYTGVIIEDANKDGIPEISAKYNRGMLEQMFHNAAQDGIPNLTLQFEAGDPRQASVFVPPGFSDNLLVEYTPEFWVGYSPEIWSPAISRKSANVVWERYPALLEVELDGVRYIPRPLDFHFSPVKFEELWGSGVLFPRPDPSSPPLTRRVLVSRSVRVERASLEFSGGTEVVELNQGIPIRAREFVGDLMVSETEFLRGRPQLQLVDLNLDGRMDTARHFRRNYRPVELEDLWNYDRDIDYTLAIEE